MVDTDEENEAARELSRTFYDDVYAERNIRGLLRPKLVTRLKERPIGVDCRRCDGRLGNGEKAGGNVCFFCPASRTTKRHTGSTGRKATLDHAPLGPNCRYSESEPPPFSALFLSYKSWRGSTHLLHYRSSLVYPLPIGCPQFTECSPAVPPCWLRHRFPLTTPQSHWPSTPSHYVTTPYAFG